MLLLYSYFQRFQVSDSLVTWLEANVTSLESLLADFYSVERGMAVVLEHLFGLNSQLVAMRRYVQVVS